ncbi:Hypothetical Protein NTJ_02564 [Nesidiocoris tenuis]|nr:Hypothetical Protein NTJ_02564 [Nesidiocoris tenuis]
MEPPKDIKGIQRFIGMVNFVGKYIPNRSAILKPITELLSSKNEFVWGHSQESAFNQIKELLSTAPNLELYNVAVPTRISSDASMFGLGGVLLQQQTYPRWLPVAYISRTLNDAEQNYSNIEQEALAVTWCCDKFKEFILGKTINIVTDHKPLLKIFTNKNLDDLTPRLQRLRLRMMRHSYTVTYTPGKHMAPADCLSRSPLLSTESYD